MIDAYPLHWPAGWKRVPAHLRKRAQFGKTTFHAYQGGGGYARKGDLSITDGTARVLDELERLDVRRDTVVISTNVRVRLDGLPRSGERAPDDPGVAVYWKDRNGTSRCMAIDRYDRVADNLAAVAATLDAMRAITRHGTAEILNRAFTGFTALPAPGQTTRTWRDILEVGEQVTLQRAQENYRRLAAVRHPDKGGSHEAMAELNGAWTAAQAELRP